MVSKSVARCLALCVPAALSYKLESSLATAPAPNFEDAVQNAHEASDLHDAIGELNTKIKGAKERYAAAKQYYDALKANIGEQIRIRESMTSHHLVERVDDGTYQSLQEQHYKSLLCAISFEAFVFGGTQEQRTGVFEVCMGRESIEFDQLTVGHSQVAVPRSTKPLLSSASLISTVAALDAEVKRLFVQEQQLARVGFLKRGPADTMRHQLEELKAEEEELQNKLSADRAQWKAEVKELKETERQLAASYETHHDTRTDVKEAAFAKVKDELCPGIAATYGGNATGIKNFISEKCGLAKP